MGGGRQRYPGSGLVGQDMGVGILSTAWGLVLRSLEEGITATTAAVMFLRMTMRGGAVTREKDHTS